MSKHSRMIERQQRKQILRVRIITSLVIMVLLLALGTAGIWWIGSQTAAVDESEPLPRRVSVEEARGLYDEGALLIDVRTEEEFQAAHIPESLSLPLEQLEEQMEFIPSSLDIIVVCRSGNRSAEGRDILLAAGFPRVASMEGGIVDWAEAGYPLEGEDL
ncbi:MAG: rhodanese-like domain-containing protein [Anaerolineales bacterium]|nr:rhodanese-like domain-containing protein [Anaerolineales bacterium]